MFEFKLVLVLISALKWIIVSSNPIKFPGCQSDVGNCEDSNDLCEFIPLPHILCEREKIKQECPRLCNNCPAVTTVASTQSTGNNLVVNINLNQNITGINPEPYIENHTEDYMVTESSKYYILFGCSLEQPILIIASIE